ncbi:MAG: ATP phosphoribosyltransferase [Deltaproteobacteria bacterium]|nr:ATP phosphoribosyltransferase [Deltaproteobacteria bacterium]|tara:strand:- start:2273 stop:3136 length:864 start_codon:yes stop_codon:yes gene_type:complete
MSDQILRLALPKGRMKDGVYQLLSEAGIKVREGARNYRPSISLDGFEVKILKPQNIIEMLHVGSRDIGFAGADWVAELGAELVEVLDTGLDPVRLVAAAPVALLENGALPNKHLVVASEYKNLTQNWIKERGMDATFVRTYGATEVFPPEDADCIVDNTATGSTLRANDLDIVDELMRSSTRMYVNPKVLDVPEKRDRIENLILILRAVLEARTRVMVEVNVEEGRLEQLVRELPCMREPTISPLHGHSGYAVKVAVLRSELPSLIPNIRAHGGTDIVVTNINQIVP